MRICRIEIVNFRGVKHGCLVLPRHSVLIGANNAGKSTVAEALALLFGRDRLLQPLCDWDFNGGLPKAHTRFSIVATITEFGDGSDADPTHFPGWFVGEQAARPVWWHGNSGAVSNETDPPVDAMLAAQVALAGRYEDETCEFESVRYFYDGECDPFIDECRTVPSERLRELGLFLLPSNREWDKLLTFGSSTFLKLLREYEAIPGKSIEEVKNELRRPKTRIEEATPFSEIVQSAERELKSFLLINETGKLVYRPTSLDALSVQRSLTAHISHTDDLLVPLARQGAGIVSLQSFLLLLAFAEQRKKNGDNFILVAEEPELHLHPSLHSRLVSRIRSSSRQSITTTQSPHVAAGFQPNETIFLRNQAGTLEAQTLVSGSIGQIKKNSIRNLYLRHRQQFYETLMGGVVIVPEGITDYQWLSLFQRVLQAFPDLPDTIDLKPVGVVPTSDAAVADTFAELHRFRCDAVPLVDGNGDGLRYVSALVALTHPPKRVIRYGDDAATECLAAFILEPAIKKPGQALKALLPGSGSASLKSLQQSLAHQKTNLHLHEELAWEALNNRECMIRAAEFFEDIAVIGAGGTPKRNHWTLTKETSEVTLYTATHIKRV